MIPKNPTAYQKLMIKIASHLPERTRKVFLHPAGPTTIFFWAPTFKWGLVFAGIGDINRPAPNIAIGQTASIVVTGLIWSRYSVVIIPVNYNLLSVNLFMAMANSYNLARGIIYQYELGESDKKK